MELHRFILLIKDISLHGDTLHSLKYFYPTLRYTIPSSLKHHIEILPTVGDLQHNYSFCNMLIQSNQNNKGYTAINSVYNWYGNAIANLLNDRNVIKITAPSISHQMIVTATHIDDGWDLLSILLSKCYPFLGDKSIDVVLEITRLKLHHNGTIYIYILQTRKRD